MTGQAEPRRPRRGQGTHAGEAARRRRAGLRRPGLRRGVGRGDRHSSSPSSTGAASRRSARPSAISPTVWRTRWTGSIAGDGRNAVLAAEAWLFAVRDASFGAALADHGVALRGDLLLLVAAERERRGATWSLSDAEGAQVVHALFTGMVQHRRLAGSAVSDDLYSRSLSALFNGLDRS